MSSPVDRRPHFSITDRLSERIRTRTAIGGTVTRQVGQMRRRRVPVHWSNLFGVAAFACIVVLLLTGVLLMFVYTPSGEIVTYTGSYRPLQGQPVSKAFESTMAISHDLRGGLLVRQAHHWAALLLPVALVLQLLVTFFTGAFRRPRQASWVLLFLLFMVALLGGWSGYALPDDMLSGTGLRIVQGVTLGIPVIGTPLTTLLFGGEYPGRIIEHLYPLHVAVVPALLVVLVAARARSSYVHKPAQFAAPGRTEDNVVGIPMWPSAAARAAGLFSVVVGVIFLFAAAVTVSPIWLYGPSSPGDASAGSQPDWYTGFLDGALRLVPPGWELEWLGRTWTLAVIVPLGVVGVFFAAVMLYPYLEAWVTADRREHHILDRPQNAATRTGIGVAGMIFYGVLWGAASADLVATQFQMSFEGVITTLQVALFVGPVVGFSFTRRVCLALQRRDREVALHGRETGRIVRMPDGKFVEVHQAVDPYELWRLVAPERVDPAPPRRDGAGRLRRGERARIALSRWFLDDRVLRVQPLGLEATADRDRLPAGAISSGSDAR